jgi:citrate lyase beta subunit
MRTTFNPDAIEPLLHSLTRANSACDAAYPGEPHARQPVHTVYGGAHLFKSDTASNLGAVARQMLQAYAPDFSSFARCVGLPGAETLPESAEVIENLHAVLDRDAEAVRRLYPAAWLAHTVYERMIAKLQREPVEDYRIDFEDGYGNRRDEEEDGHAVAAAKAIARGAGSPGFPPFIGIRIKPFTEILRGRGIRTLDLFLTALLDELGRVPENLAITLPKITSPEQVSTLARLLDLFESHHDLTPGSLRIELMIETPQSIFYDSGRVAIPGLIHAAAGRCRGLHFGVYDYTASCNVIAEHQSMVHPACDFARHALQVACAGRAVTLSDGATNIMPVPKHRPAAGSALTPQQIVENRSAVQRAMRLHYDHIQRSLAHAYYQGWDLHPGQLPTRYAAVYAFFLESFDAAAARLRNFVEKAAQATLVGDVFDDAATGQGLLNFFLRGINCGAFTEQEACATGLTIEELRGRSFLKILNNRRA